MFLYHEVLKSDLGDLGEFTWALPTSRLPVVLNHAEAVVIKAAKFHKSEWSKWVNWIR